MTKIARMFRMMVLVFAVSVISANAQKADAYIRDMGQALQPFGFIEAPSCHNVEIHPASTFESVVLATGTNEKGEVLWSIYPSVVLRFNFDMSDLNEDKVRSDMAISLSSFTKHQEGTPYQRDLAMVLIETDSPTKMITVHKTDTEKLNSLQGKGQDHFTESELEVKIVHAPAVIFSLSDKDRADAFVNALKKAIIACKAQ